MNTWKDFISSLTTVETIRRAKDQVVLEWGDDVPPTLLFASLGRAIAEGFSKLSNEERTFTFDIIERGMDASDVSLKSLVAAGLLEALDSQASKRSELANAVHAQLGVASTKYLTEWKRWHDSPQ